MAKVLLSGYYGFGNIGDEAILAATVESLREKQPDLEIAVLSADPAGTSATYSVESYERMSLRGIYSGMSGTDLVVFGGGSLLQDDTSFRSLLYYLSIIVVARILGKPVVIYANGIGPVRSASGRMLTRLALALSRRVTVRDPESEKFLKRIGVKKPVRVTADPAFLLSPSPAERRSEILRNMGVSEDARIVWLALRPGKAPDKFYAAFIPAVSLLRSRGYEPCMLVMQGKDQQLVQTMNGALSAAGQKPMPSVEGLRPGDALAVLGAGKFCLGMRLHTLILAARATVPFMGVEIDPKIGAFCRAAGCPVLPDPQKAPSVNMVLEFERFMDNRDRLEARLIERLPLFRALAEDNVDMVLSVMRSLSDCV